jgi:hypothetical protein
MYWLKIKQISILLIGKTWIIHKNQVKMSGKMKIR